MKKFLVSVLMLALIMASTFSVFASEKLEQLVNPVDWETSSANVITETVDKGMKVTINNPQFDTESQKPSEFISTKNKLKLDGLHLQIRDINMKTGHKTLNVSFSNTNDNVINTNAITFLANDYGAAITGTNPEYKEMFDEKNISYNKAITDIYFVKLENGDFMCHATGGNSFSHQIKKEHMVSTFGNADPEVYVKLSNAWYAVDSVSDNTFTVTACSTGNSNGFTSYFGQYSSDGTTITDRLVAVKQEGVLEGIEIEYWDNEGGSATTVKKVALDGLTIKGIEIDYNAMFRLGTTPGVSTASGFNGQGPLLRVDEDGTVWASYLEGGVGEDDEIGKFDTPKEKFTIECFRQADGGYNFFISGDESGQTFVLAASPEDIEELYGTNENVMVYISYSELDREENKAPKFTKIASITNESAAAENTPIKESDVKTTIDKNKVKVTVEKADRMAYTYQWYANKTDSNTGGDIIDGATQDTYTIPSGWKAGDYYVYCEVSSLSRRGEKTTVATNTVKYTVEDDKKEENNKPTGTTKDEDTAKDDTTTTNLNSNGANTGINTFAMPLTVVIFICAGTLVILRKKKA